MSKFRDLFWYNQGQNWKEIEEKMVKLDKNWIFKNQESNWKECQNSRTCFYAIIGENRKKKKEIRLKLAKYGKLESQ